MRFGSFAITFVMSWLISAGPLVSAQAQNISHVSLTSSNICLSPDEPYPYKLAKTDPLYETARDEHQRHLESLETYVNCLDRERGAALDQLHSSFNLFLSNFGEDAVLKYGSERKERQ